MLFRRSESFSLPPPGKCQVLCRGRRTTAIAWGHSVTVARDALEALELATEFKPDMALVDIDLPGMDGYELARRWRTTATGRNSPW
jgi:CheY-like chemotaxis protein